ncbi:tyrosine-protein phosphatase [Propionibacteriaceae bacterium Y2011]
MPWLEFDSLVNARDLGGTPCTDGGVINSNRLLRSDNLQDLTGHDIRHLLDLGLTDVVDLRSTMEVRSEGPGPLESVDDVRIHHFSYLPETDLKPLPEDDPADVSGADTSGVDAPEEALPWVGKAPSVDHDDVFASHYLSYLKDRPDDVVAALRTIAYAQGAALVHCAAGKDRTGTTVAMALTLAGADREAVVADYAASSERMQLIIDRLSASPTYRANLAGRPLSSHLTNAETMVAVLDQLDQLGGVEAALMRLGWTSEDTAAMRANLRG